MSWTWQTVPELRVAVAAACRTELGHARAVAFVLDLAEVTFMDSAALHALADIDAEVPAGLPRWRTDLAAAPGSAATRRAVTLPQQRSVRCDRASVGDPTAGRDVA